MPLDLLHVARTTKGFRCLLMHRSAVAVWRAALANVPDFPPCPPDLSEPAYANLAFDGHCHVRASPKRLVITPGFTHPSP
jgi:hypothetical protein